MGRPSSYPGSSPGTPPYGDSSEDWVFVLTAIPVGGEPPQGGGGAPSYVAPHSTGTNATRPSARGNLTLRPSSRPAFSQPRQPLLPLSDLPLQPFAASLGRTAVLDLLAIGRDLTRDLGQLLLEGGPRRGGRGVTPSGSGTPMTPAAVAPAATLVAMPRPRNERQDHVAPLAHQRPRAIRPEDRSRAGSALARIPLIGPASWPRTTLGFPVGSHAAVSRCRLLPGLSPSLTHERRSPFLAPSLPDDLSSAVDLGWRRSTYKWEAPMLTRSGFGAPGHCPKQLDRGEGHGSEGRSAFQAIRGQG